jgi:hypothetical protein
VPCTKPCPRRADFARLLYWHAHIATTADIYVKEVSEQAVEAMERLERHVDAELKKEQKSESGDAYSAPNLHRGSWAVAPYAE